jgi:hypothetical protein
MTSRRRLTSTATAQQLSGGKGGCPAARGAAPNSTEAHVPAHEDEKQVRWLDTGGVAEIEVRCSGGGLPKADKRRWREINATGGGAFDTHTHGERG